MTGQRLSPETSAVLREMLAEQVRDSRNPRKNRFWRRRVSVVAVLIALALGAFGGAGVAVGVGAIQPIFTGNGLGPQQKYATNAHGQTYGSSGTTSPYLPDLIQVRGTGPNGEEAEGYVYAGDIQQPMPTSPADAARVQAEWAAKYPRGKTVKLYAKDGTTVIGTWVEGQPRQG